jgi:hypothetical protein
MIEYKDVMPIPFFKKEPFTGSYQGMRYRMEKTDVPDDENPEEMITRLCVHVWPQPFCFEKTDEQLKTKQFFEFSSDGILRAVDWMNQIYDNEKTRWTRE